jgi:hypothetical protein
VGGVRGLPWLFLVARRLHSVHLGLVGTTWTTLLDWTFGFGH